MTTPREQLIKEAVNVYTETPWNPAGSHPTRKDAIKRVILFLETQGWTPPRSEDPATITSDPEIRGGHPCITGTRIGYDAIGDTLEEAQFAFPQLTDKQIQVALVFKASYTPTRKKHGGKR